jgi:thiol-disulfide isomerase/thioredoxin
MKKSALILFFTIIVCYAQGQHKKMPIQGSIVNDSLKRDSVLLTKGGIAAAYFEQKDVSVPVINGTFRLSNSGSYPQMYRVLFASDKGMRVWRWGVIFIDRSTTRLQLDYLKDECFQVNGTTASEFRDKFIPFMLGREYDCSTNSFYELSSNEDSGFEFKLMEYVRKNPSSYVALWSLVERFSLFGHTMLRENILNSFARNIKSSWIWKLLRSDLLQAPIKENFKFPNIQLKTIQLEASQLKIPKAKFVFIDYWFSRCRPCLDTIPYLKKIYSLYHSKGLEIVSISTDKTKDIAIWQRRVKEYGLIWPQYLDENAVNANKLSVNSFPTTFLLDENGIMIKRNISPADLEKLLKDKLK